VSDNDDEDATLPIQQELSSRHDQVHLNLLNLAGLSEEAFTLVSEGRSSLSCQTSGDKVARIESTDDMSKDIKNDLSW
jgi:hypothetical protein